MTITSGGEQLTNVNPEVAGGGGARKGHTTLFQGPLSDERSIISPVASPASPGAGRA